MEVIVLGYGNGITRGTIERDSQENDISNGYAFGRFLLHFQLVLSLINLLNPTLIAFMKKYVNVEDIISQK